MCDILHTMDIKIKSFLKKNIDIIVTAVLAVLFLAGGFAGIFQKLDFRMYDFLLGKKQEPKQSPNILFVNIDNESIDAMGEWPWTRDIFADSLLRMKELGATGAVFDVEFLSPSHLGVAPKAVQNVSSAFTRSSNDISDTVLELSNAVSSGQVTKAELPDMTKTMLDQYISPTLSELKNQITGNMFRDNDDYFARSIQFLGNTWLTINNRDVAIQIPEEEKKYVRQRFLFTKVTDKKNYIMRDNAYTDNEQYNGEKGGFSPALSTFMQHANGAGFTNVILDSDGTRRRIELFTERDGKYIGQLVFSPLMNMLDAQGFVRGRSSLVVKGALYPGETKRRDVRIPLDNHGRMLINWLHKDLGQSFRHESVLFLKQLDFMEDNITVCLENIPQLEIRDKNGEEMMYVTAAKELNEEYSAITKEKDALLAKCSGYDADGKVKDGLTPEDYETYFKMRSDFFSNVSDYISADFLKEIDERLSSVKKQISAAEFSDFNKSIHEQFDDLKHEYELYSQYEAEMKKQYSGSFCIIGNTASSTTDMGVTPFAAMYANVGTHANVMNTILQRNFIIPLSWLWSFLLAVVLSFIALIITRGKSSKRQNFAGGAAITAVIAVCISLMLFAGIYIPAVTASLFIITAYIADIVIRFTTSEKEKGFLRQAFSTYLSKDVVNEIVNDPGKLTLGGEDKHITALFTDIKSFSSFSELVTPTQLVSILNIYLGMLSDTILQFGGTIDKYIGDEIVSFFGAPLNLPDHAYKACCAGVRMKQAEAEFNKKHLADGDIPRSLETRVGINTGNMVVGNMGTSMKMNYTIMGNDVNLASRLEGVNKVYRSWVLVSEQTWKEADSGEHAGELVSRRLDKVRVIGINKPVQLYNVLGFKSEMSRVQLDEIALFHQALDKYLAKDFNGAGKMFVEANKMFPDDGAAIVFAERCKEYISKGIPDGWDGVMNMTSK